MIIAEVQFNRWDKIYNFDTHNLTLKKFDYVVVDTELGREIGKVVSIYESEISADEAEEDKHKKVLRKASTDDLSKIPSEEDKDIAMEKCKKMIEKYQLPMKLVDVHFAFDGSRITFAFIADGRVDFRELVKELTTVFNKTIRLNQIGTRDEARVSGDCGPCGRKLCCNSHIKEFSSITSEMAETQQVVHRGSERISGMCGRLKCCLAYEQQGYEELVKKLPAIGTRVNVDGKSGVVVGQHVLRQSVGVEFKGEKGESSYTAQVDLNRKKKGD